MKLSTEFLLVNCAIWIFPSKEHPIAAAVTLGIWLVMSLLEFFLDLQRPKD